jgi:hypothetical protein
VFTRLAGRTIVPPFILVLHVRVRKRLDVDGAVQARHRNRNGSQHCRGWSRTIGKASLCGQYAGLRCRLKGNPDPRRQSFGKVPERKTVIGVRIEKGS